MGQFYESALTDHKTAFLFTKTHEKVHKNAWKKSTETHLKTEDEHIVW